jgi:hypothetical protein
MAKRFTITLNDKALNKQIKRAMRKNPKETARAVTACTLDLAGESAKRAPIETGGLRNDCHAQVNGSTVFSKRKRVGTSVSPSSDSVGEVAYSLPYALRQHEDLSLRHSGPEHGDVDGGEAKYLERPFEERKARYIQRFAKIVERSLK